MVKPISLRLRNAEILAKARATLIKAGRGPELERRHAARVMEEARAIVDRRREQDRLRRVAVLAAQKAILVVNKTYRAQDQIDADETERARWQACRALVLDELNKIITQGRRP
jgi:hypothetical protein